jgi:hypothetical protein
MERATVTEAKWDRGDNEVLGVAVAVWVGGGGDTMLGGGRRW